MAFRRFLTCAFGAFLLGTFSASSLAAQSDWPPDDEPTYTVPPQQDSAAQTQQYGYGQADVAPQFGGNGQQGYGSGYGQQEYGAQQGDAQGMRSDQLSQLVAPIALYPDSLVAQILTAATCPAQVAGADRWLQGMKGAAPEQIAAGAEAQTSWDPSVKALTAFPQVLEMLDQNLQWTSDLGSAYYNQPQDVLSTIQVLRQRAEQAGNLQPSQQEQVTDNDGYIAIAPQNPEMVYVPTYNPWAAYGQPIYPYPEFSFVGEFGSFFGSRVAFGLGYAMGPWFRAPFGWSRWDLDWRRDSIWFNHEAFWTHSREMRDWGFRYGGPRWRGGEGWGRGGDRGGYGADGIVAVRCRAWATITTNRWMCTGATGGAADFRMYAQEMDSEAIRGSWGIQGAIRASRHSTGCL